MAVLTRGGHEPRAGSTQAHMQIHARASAALPKGKQKAAVTHVLRTALDKTVIALTGGRTEGTEWRGARAQDGAWQKQSERP